MFYDLILVRHGASLAYVDYENDDVPTYRQGHNTPLSDTGKKESHAAGKQLAIYRPTLLIASQLTRARESANIIAEYSPLFVNTDWRLNEICRPSVDGQNIYSEVNLEYKKWRGEMIEKRNWKAKFSSQDQSFFEFKEQVVDFLRESAKEFDGQKTVLVGHSQSFATIMAIIKNGYNQSPNSFFEIFNRSFMANGAITKLSHDRRGWKIDFFNRTSHL